MTFHVVLYPIRCLLRQYWFPPWKHEHHDHPLILAEAKGKGTKRFGCSPPRYISHRGYGMFCIEFSSYLTELNSRSMGSSSHSEAWAAACFQGISWTAKDLYLALSACLSYCAAWWQEKHRKAAMGMLLMLRVHCGLVWKGPTARQITAVKSLSSTYPQARVWATWCASIWKAPLKFCRVRCKMWSSHKLSLIWPPLPPPPTCSEIVQMISVPAGTQIGYATLHKKVLVALDGHYRKFNKSHELTVMFSWCSRQICSCQAIWWS